MLNIAPSVTTQEVLQHLLDQHMETIFSVNVQKQYSSVDIIIYPVKLALLSSEQLMVKHVIMILIGLKFWLTTLNQSLLWRTTPSPCCLSSPPVTQLETISLTDHEVGEELETLLVSSTPTPNGITTPIFNTCATSTLPKRI